MSNKEVGNRGEKQAQSYLVNEGFEIVTRNYRVRQGEIDIIATKSGKLYFFEVKTRRGSRFGSARQSFPGWRVKRMHSAGLMFLSQNSEYSDYEIEFSLITIDDGNLTMIPIDTEE